MLKPRASRPPTNQSPLAQWETCHSQTPLSFSQVFAPYPRPKFTAITTPVPTPCTLLGLPTLWHGSGAPGGNRSPWGSPATQTTLHPHFSTPRTALAPCEQGNPSGLRTGSQPVAGTALRFAWAGDNSRVGGLRDRPGLKFMNFLKDVHRRRRVFPSELFDVLASPVQPIKLSLVPHSMSTKLIQE